MSRMKADSVWNRELRRNVAIHQAFSKWPMARVVVTAHDAASTVLFDHFVPTGRIIELALPDSTHARLVVHSVFNGTRAIGEPEAVTVERRP